MTKVTTFPIQKASLGTPTLLYAGNPYRVVNSGTSTYVARYTKPFDSDVVITKIVIKNSSITTHGYSTIGIVQAPSTFRAWLWYEVEVSARGSVEMSDLCVPLKSGESIVAGAIYSASSELSSPIEISIYGEVLG